MTFGIEAVHKEWIQSVFEKKNWVVIWGKKGFGDRKSVVSSIGIEEREQVGILESFFQAIDTDQVHGVLGFDGRFELRYRGARKQG
jgi:hypothetical protein